MFNNMPKQDVNELALEYLEQKYGEKFEYSAPAGSSYTGTRSFLATCESFGDRRILVQIENFTDNENLSISDNYIAIKYEDNVRDFFKQIADEEFGSSKIFYNASGRTLSPEMSATASFDEYLRSEDGLISAVISLHGNGYKNTEQLRSLANQISNRFSCREISILLIVVDDNTFSNSDESELRNIFLTRSGIVQARFERYNDENNLDIWEEN